MAVEICLHLGGGKLLLTGWMFNLDEASLTLSVFTPGKSTPLKPQLTRYLRPEIARGLALDPAEPCGFISVVDTGAAVVPERCRLQLDDGRRMIQLDTAISDATQDYPRLLETLRSSLSVEARLIAFEEIAAAEILDPLTPVQRAQFMAAWNAAVAECATAATGWAELYIETAQRLANYGTLLGGWLNCDRSVLEKVEFVRVDGSRQCISTAWTRFERPDVTRTLRERGEFLDTDEIGFLAAIETPCPPDRRCYLVLTRSDGLTQRVRIDERASPSDPVAVVMLILNSFTTTSRRLSELMDAQIGPAISEVWRTRRTPPTDTIEFEFGHGTERPVVSVIVPIYGRYDFIEYQIAQFCNDPAMRQSELIYVIDDPLIYDRARLLCDDVNRLYDFPFRILYRQANQGFAAATNLGARHARAGKLLLMNSDVFPSRPGWLPMLIEAHDNLPNPGAVAPKLLFEDGSIQHSGIRFARHPGWGGMWINEHPLIGQPDDPAAREPVEFAALTAACLLIDAALYQEVGGLSEDYIIGDFEDSDLCLRLREVGRRNWLVPRVTLYHLERQSQAVAGNPTWRTNLTLYNCWVHHQRWNDTIERIETGQQPRHLTELA
jgi:GT2 family glycosyltransferase